MKDTKYREQLYDIFSRRETDVSEKVAQSLTLGSEYLDLPIGFFTQIDDGTQEIVEAVGDNPRIQPGERCPLEEAYCHRTVEIDSALSVQDVRDASVISQRAIDNLRLGSYIGARVVVDDETYGTVCFADYSSRETAFSDPEEYFVELLSGLIGQAITQREYERELENRESELNEQLGIYNAIIESSFDLVFRIDTGGRFTFLSPSFEDLLGYPREEFLDQSLTRLTPDEETRELAVDLFEQVMAGETIEHQYLPLKHRNGSQLFVDVRVTPIYADCDGPRTPEDIVAAQGTVRDATDRFRRQRLIKILNRVLRHNLRNDITIVQGFAETLHRRVDGENAEFANRIVETTERLIGLSETARKLEETIQSSPTMASTDIVPIVRRAGSQIDERYPAASVSIETPERAVAETAPRLETAVWELADNAAKHGGETPTVTLTVAEQADAVTIRISDDGPGLPEQERAILVSGEESPLVHGSGLGLWLVHWIVESIGGDIRATGATAGTCIEISLPKAGAS
jgi:two-component system aerobic respiration control sensor histidine kinase ArcB